MKTAMVGLAALAVCAWSEAMADVNPGAGEYYAQAYASSVSDPGDCLIIGGSSFPVLVTYGGISAKLIQARIAAVNASSSSVYSFLLTLTSGAGTTSPGGNLSLRVTKDASTLLAKGTFSASITESTTKSFLMGLTVAYTLPGRYRCSMQLDLALAKV